MTGGKSRFISDRRVPGGTSWVEATDWEAGTAENIEISGEDLVAQTTHNDETPDSMVSRPADEGTGTGDHDEGLRFTVSQAWKDFQARISGKSGTASDETAVIVRSSDGVQIASVDISGNSSHDVITFYDVNLSKGTSYYVYGQTSNSRTKGYRRANAPYTSSDGNLTIDGGYQNGRVYTGNTWRFVTIGNINL